MPYATNGGVRTWYVTAGAGPAMVLVHANPFDHRLWLYQTAHFSHFFRVIAVDLRAYGRSDKPETRYSFAGEPVGLAERDDGSWLVLYDPVELGVIDHRGDRLIRPKHPARGLVDNPDGLTTTPPAQQPPQPT